MGQFFYSFTSESGSIHHCFFRQMASLKILLRCLCRKAYIQVCRGLMIASVCLGFFGAALALVGMKCTKIGGSQSTKARLTSLSGVHFILCGKQPLDLSPALCYSHQHWLRPNGFREPVSKSGSQATFGPGGDIHSSLLVLCSTCAAYNAHPKMLSWSSARLLSLTDQVGEPFFMHFF